MGPLIFVLILALLPLGFAATSEPAAPVSRLGQSYLGPAKLPDSVALLPPPPAEGTNSLKRDQRWEMKALKLQGTARWDLATSDADLFTAKATNAMSCAAGFAIGASTTPKLDALLRKTMPDFGRAPYAAKEKYKRPRPFMSNGKPTCTPDMENILRQDGSYPSGHAAIGYGWSFILAELVPARKREILARGAAFADSRRVCNVHFISDVEAGKTIAGAVFDLLKQDATYVADFEAAKAEVRALRAAKPDCAVENAALKLR